MVQYMMADNVSRRNLRPPSTEIELNGKTIGHRDETKQVWFEIFYLL